MFLPSKRLLSAFYKTPPSKNPSKNLVFTENPYRRLLRTLLRKHLRLENLLRTLLRSVRLHDPLVCALFGADSIYKRPGLKQPGLGDPKFLGLRFVGPKNRQIPAKSGWPRFGLVRLQFGCGTVRAVPVFGSSAAPQQSEICVKFSPFFTPFLT